jgi:hypothetical protein
MHNRSSSRSTGQGIATEHRLPQRIALLAVMIAIAAAVQAPAATAGIPGWLQTQVNAPTAQPDARTAAVVLYSDTNVSVLTNGRIRRTERRVYRILRPEGRDRGVVRVDFDSRTRITGLHAWCIPASGKPYEVGDSDAVESGLIGVLNGQLMSDVRTRLLRIPAAAPGNVVGYELETEETPYVMSDDWVFQDTIPVREARYTLQLPDGWGYKASWLNHTEVAPSSSARGQTQWVVNDAEAIRVEQRMPPWHGIAGRLVIALQPPNGQAGVFQSWREMGNWYLGLTRGRTDDTPEIRQKVAELTAATPTMLGKLQALAGFVQNDIRYVAIELGIGGLQPHAAGDVFAHRYGDCKDKATLLSSMLREIGVESYYVIINHERGAISETSLPNLGFDHAILAVRVPAGVDDPSLQAIAVHPRLGRILFFDPTEPLVPFGRLRGTLQANYGLLVTPDGGELVRLPQLAPDSNAIQRTAKMTLDEMGTLRGEVHESWAGDRALLQREAMQSAAQDADRIRPVESVVASSLTDFRLLKATVANARLADRPFEWNYTLEADGYAKSAGDLLLVRPRILGSKSSGLLETGEPRQHPIEFEGPERDTDVFEIALPPGYEIDELPPPVSADYGFASYQSRTERVGHALRYTRTFEIRELSVPVSRAEKLREFYRIIEGDEHMSAVLKQVRH